jgi:cytochrome P450
MHLPAFLNDVTIPLLEYHRRAREWYRSLRPEHPVFFDEDHQVWVVIGYPEGLRVRDDHATFSSAHNIRELDFSTIAGMDPPRHTQMRSLVTQALSARTIAKMAPDVEAITHDLLDQAFEHEQVDWVAELAHPLPLQIVAQMLGLPKEDWPLYRNWTDAAVNQRDNWAQASQNFGQLFTQAIEEHKRQPKQDVLGLLLTAEVDGQRLSFLDVIGFCFTLFVAGYITTANLLGNAILCLDQHPESLALLRANRDLVPRFVEEIVRYMHPFRGVPSDIKLVEGRYVTADTQLGGQLIRKGDFVKVDHLSISIQRAPSTVIKHLGMACIIAWARPWPA